MTNEEILNKAIDRATPNGFKYDFNIKYNSKKDRFEKNYKNFRRFEIKYIIFSHDFCKAFFGEEKIDFKSWDNFRPRMLYSWQYHLQQMILEKEPLKYLEKFLEEK